MKKNHLFCLLDGRMDFERWRKNEMMYILGEKDELEPLCWYENSRYIPDENTDPRLQEVFKKNPQEYLFDPEKFQEFLLQKNRSRISATLLINSSGGIASTPFLINVLSDTIKMRGGNLDAFVTTTAQSAAANVMLDSERTSLLKKTYGMWHNSRNNPQRSKKIFFDKEEVKRDLEKVGTSLMAELKEKMLSRILPEKKESMSAAFDGMTVADSCLEMEGEELKEYGLADDVHNNVAALLQVFKDRYDNQCLLENKTLQAFWRRSFSEEEICKKMGRAIIIWTNPNGSISFSNVKNSDQSNFKEDEAKEMRKIVSKFDHECFRP